MNVHVAALADVGDSAADVMAVFQNGVTGLDVAESDFVTEWHGVESLELYGLVSLHDPACQLLAGAHVLHHNHADCIGFVVHNELRSHSSPQIRVRCPTQSGQECRKLSSMGKSLSRREGKKGRHVAPAPLSPPPNPLNY